MVRRCIQLPRLQPRPRGQTPPRPIGPPGQHHHHALGPKLLPAQTSKIPPTQGQVSSFAVPTEHCDFASDPRIAAQQRYGLMALSRPTIKRPVGVWNAGEFGMAENWLSLLRKHYRVPYDPVTETGHDKHALSPRQSRISGRVWQSAPCRSPRGAVTYRV